MRAFEIQLNGETVTAAGLSHDGMVGVHITWIDEAPDGKSSIVIHGLSADTKQYTTWTAQDIDLGDIVGIRLIEIAPELADEPQVQTGARPLAAHECITGQWIAENPDPVRRQLYALRAKIRDQDAIVRVLAERIEEHRAMISDTLKRKDSTPTTEPEVRAVLQDQVDRYQEILKQDEAKLQRQRSRLGHVRALAIQLDDIHETLQERKHWDGLERLIQQIVNTEKELVLHMARAHAGTDETKWDDLVALIRAADRHIDDP